MEALLYFAFWAGLIFLMMRFGCGAHVMGHGHQDDRTQSTGGGNHDGEVRWIAPATDVDPVCGKTVKTGQARPSVHNGHVYYFCSRECRERFEVAPDLYVNPTKMPAGHKEHSHA